MAGRVIDATLRFVDNFTAPMQKSITAMTNGSKGAIKLGKDIEKAGKSITNVGSKLTTTLTLPIVGLAGASVKTAAEFEASMSNVKAITGATGEDFEKLTTLAQDLGKTTAWSASEVAEAMQYTGMAGWSAQQNIDGLAGVLNLASATGTDLARTSDILTDAISAFGDTAADSARYADVMTAASTNANVNVELLGESYKYVGSLAGTMGYEIDQVTTALAAMGNQGIKGSQAGTSLKNAISNLAAPTDAMQKAMDQLGISIVNSDGTMKSFEDVIDNLQGSFAGLTEDQQAAYAKTLFGKNAMAGMLAVINTSAEDYDKLADAISNSGGAAEDAANTQLDNLQGQLTLLKSAVEGIAISFGNKMLPYLKKAAEFAQGLADKINGLSDEQMDLILKIAAVVAAIGPALMIFGKMVSIVGKGIQIFNMVRRAITLAGGAIGLITSPVGIAIIAIVALIAIIVLLIKNWDKVKAAAANVWNYVKSVFASMGNAASGLGEKFAGIKEKVGVFVNAVKNLWTVIQPVVSAIGSLVATVFQAQIGAAIGAAIGFFTNMANTVMAVVGGILDILSGIITFLTGVFTGNWQQAWEGIVSIFSGIFDTIVALAKAPINGVISIINGAIAGINNLGLTIPDWVPVIGGKSFSINIPTIPTLASGTDYWRGGIAQVSERGGEIIDLPRGSRVYPAGETERMLRNQAAGNHFTLEKLADSIIVREDADIDRIAEALERKLTKVALNMGGAYA